MIIVSEGYQRANRERLDELNEMLTSMAAQVSYQSDVPVASVASLKDRDRSADDKTEAPISPDYSDHDHG